MSYTEAQLLGAMRLFADAVRVPPEFVQDTVVFCQQQAHLQWHGSRRVTPHEAGPWLRHQVRLEDHPQDLWQLPRVEVSGYDPAEMAAYFSVPVETLSSIALVDDRDDLRLWWTGGCSMSLEEYERLDESIRALLTEDDQ